MWKFLSIFSHPKNHNTLAVRGGGGQPLRSAWVFFTPSLRWGSRFAWCDLSHLVLLKGGEGGGLQRWVGPELALSWVGAKGAGWVGWDPAWWLHSHHQRSPGGSGDSYRRLHFKGCEKKWILCTFTANPKGAVRQIKPWQRSVFNSEATKL